MGWGGGGGMSLNRPFLFWRFGVNAGQSGCGGSSWNKTREYFNVPGFDLWMMNKNFYYYTSVLEDVFSAGAWHLPKAFTLIYCTHPIVTLTLPLFWTHKANVLNEVFIVAVSGVAMWAAMKLCAQPNGPLSSQGRLSPTLISSVGWTCQPGSQQKIGFIAPQLFLEEGGF